MVGKGSECVMCMEVENKEETVEGAQAPAVAAIPAIGAKAAPKLSGPVLHKVSQKMQEQ